MAETNSEADDATGRRSIATLGLMLLVRGYQRFGSAWLGGHCRFEPSCSCYAMEALERHGALRGGWLSMRRVLRCRPGGGAGPDPVPPRTKSD
ncbi:MAG: membrane protein insertion efficiency factor YidD [Phycisphaerae bacterium]|nr:membrane protein insertion efficiency factor YidD [Phycisphaerae bacterium]OUX01401.1 MAG: membrane protein insertion efficiency factor YidD [Phycisphaeraceae bacterium TMED231]